MNAPLIAKWSKADYQALAICVTVGLLLSIAPHLATLARHGTWEYISDGDERQYLAITRIAYQGENSLRDPYLGNWEAAPTQFPWVPFGPAGQFNRLLGLPLLASSFEWRFAGGVLFAAALY